ncbi:MAG: ABC-2 family transporter protein [Planctomyces sp.]|nr:ABC-2 family transporter protein [Planctomyces sp.]
MSFRPNYSRVWLTFVRNSLIREMTFRGNFIAEVLTILFWFAAQIVLFDVIYRHAPLIRDWTRHEYFAFMATGMLVNSIVEALFMPNCANFGELIRTGNLDFALLKPIDTQFLISTQYFSWSQIVEIALAIALLVRSVWASGIPVTPGRVIVYAGLVACAVAFYYALMLVLASTSVWLGRNQSLYDFWFYITSFGRYPQNVYRGQSAVGDVIWFGFSFLVPLLLVITLPARVVLSKVIEPDIRIIVLAPAGTLLLLWVARVVFQKALNSYRSASS